jgi:hypothetical protein
MRVHSDQFGTDRRAGSVATDHFSSSAEQGNSSTLGFGQLAAALAER